MDTRQILSGACAAFLLLIILLALLAIHTWRNTVRRNRLAAFRGGLLRTREEVALLRRVLSHGACREIGAYVAARVCAIHQGGVSKDMLTGLLGDMARRPYVLTAMELGIRDSKAAQAIRDAGERLVRSAVSGHSLAPMITEILRAVAQTIDSSARTILSPDFYHTFLLDPALFEEKVAGRLARMNLTRLHHREIAEIVCEAAIEALDGPVGRAIRELEKVVRIVVRTLVRMPDRKLAGALNRANTRYHRVTADGLADDRRQGIDRAFHYIEQLKEFFAARDAKVLEDTRTVVVNLEMRPRRAKAGTNPTAAKAKEHSAEQTRQIEMFEYAMRNRHKSQGQATGLDEDDERDSSVDVVVEDDE